MMDRLLLAVLALAASLTLAAPAGAVVYVEGSGEPAFTNTTTNTQWVRWQGNAAYEQYKLEYDSYANSVLVTTQNGGYVSPNGSGVTWVDWGGVVEPLQEGVTYTICGYGRYWIGGIPTRDTGSCFDADQTGRRASTTIDRTKPSIAVKIDNGAAYSRTAKLNYHIDYSDNLAFPFPANFLCRDIGTDPATACAKETHQYNEACSVPLGGMKKVTYFNCDEDLSGANIADGPVTLCVVSADGAIPDNPSSSNQAQSADKANLSNRVCDSITIDRTAPSVAIQPSATTVYAGDLVSFGVQAADAGSGVSGAYDWTWGDNTPAGAGETATHTYTAPGTYQVALKTRDVAGNEAVATQVISVTARPSTGGDTGGGGTAGGSTGGGTTGVGTTGGGTTGGGTTTPTGTGTAGGGGAVTAPPTVREISASAGGGGTQETTVAGLEVLAPKRLKLTARTKALAIALTAEGPGKVALALVRAGRVHARGTALITSAGTLGYRLRLPRKLKPGTYQLKISFTPDGATRATTRTARLVVAAARKKARAKSSGALARAASVRPRVAAAGAPVGVPTGAAPEAPRSRQVRLPLE